MDELVRWLGEQLDEDERIARAAADGDSGEWFMSDKWNVYRAEDESPHDDVETNVLVVYGNVKSQSEHIAAHDPARVLREIDAKRRMLDRYEELLAASKEQGLIGDVTEEYQDFLLRLLALPYADRPGYREEWAP